MASRADIANIIAAMKAAFPNYNPDLGTPEKPGQTPKMFLAGLEDIDSETLMAAAYSKIFESGRAFAPSIGEIRGEAISLQARAAGIPDAWQAYSEVIDKPTKGEKCGEFQRLDDGTMGYPRKPLEWSHAVVEKVAYLMGWPKQFPSSEPGIDRAQFIKAYDAELSRVLADAARLPMVTQYIEAKRLELQGQPLLAQVGKLVRKLEVGHE